MDSALELLSFSRDESLCPSALVARERVENREGSSARRDMDLIPAHTHSVASLTFFALSLPYFLTPRLIWQLKRKSETALLLYFNHTARCERTFFPSYRPEFALINEACFWLSHDDDDDDGYTRFSNIFNAFVAQNAKKKKIRLAEFSIPLSAWRNSGYTLHTQLQRVRGFKESILIFKKFINGVDPTKNKRNRVFYTLLSIVKPYTWRRSR